jgi:hypothetical protein
MALDTAPAARAAIPAHALAPATLAAFGLALFSSAFLIFWIEPLFARMLLPRAGGSQAVWNTCLVFFQLSLLLGYTYAHLLTRLLPLAGQAVAHLTVLALGMLFLPVVLSPDWAPSTAGSPVISLFAILTVTLGGPFLALSANAPLLQHWFSFTGHRRAENPYVLYAASNAGSLAALLAYPFLIEPTITLGQQSGAWAMCYGVLCLLVAVSGALVVRSAAAPFPAAIAAPIRLGSRIRVTWLVYAALPSSLLVGITSYISTDIASFPLLWIAPLALYLATFILTFAARPPISHATMVRMLPLAIVLAAAGFWLSATSLVLAIAVHLFAFFLIAMACHGELARLKPPVVQLTEFYFWLSLGGVVGGALTALVSPLVFDSIVEYPLALACVCLLRPGEQHPLVRGAECGGLFATIAIILGEPLLSYGASLSLALTFGLIMLVAGFGLRPGRINLLLLAVALLLVSHTGRNLVIRYGATQWRDRSFYGAYSVTQDAAGRRMMYHGTTNHGLERFAAPGKPVPMLYYGAGGPLSDIMHAIGPRSTNIAVVGLGIGNMACYATPAQSWTFYEIDALVYRLAAKSGLFRSLPECVPGAKVILGDGRLNLAKQPAGTYDLLIVDAFASDSVPIHLMTREAFAGYRQALSEHGVLVMHVTNRHFDLAPIVAKIASVTGFVIYQRDFVPPAGTEIADLAPSHWLVLARDDADLAGLQSDPNWSRGVPQPATRLWTDDFANILSALR